MLLLRSGKNLAPTNGFNNIFKISIFMISTKSYQKIKILLAAPFYTLFDHRKITKFYIIQNYIIFEASVFAREVSQKSILALPCCMGVIIFFDPHPAWECEKQLLRHLPSENAIFSFFRHLPSGKLKNHENALLEPPRRRHVAKDAIRKSLQKWQIPPATLFFIDF